MYIKINQDEADKRLTGHAWYQVDDEEKLYWLKDDAKTEKIRRNFQKEFNIVLEGDDYMNNVITVIKK